MKYTIDDIITYKRGGKLYLRIGSRNVGYTILKIIESDIPLIDVRLFVIYPRFRGRGIGSMYINYLREGFNLSGLSLNDRFWKDKMGAEIDIDSSFFLKKLSK